MYTFLQRDNTFLAQAQLAQYQDLSLALYAAYHCAAIDCGIASQILCM